MATPEPEPSQPPPTEDKTAVDTFSATFGTFEVPEDPEDDAQTATIDSYDPFGIGAALPKKASAKKQQQQQQQQPEQKVKKEQPKQKVTKRASDNNSQAIPPLMAVNFKIHEEISSYGSMDPDLEGSSEIAVQGGVLAQVTSSDALKNSPWILLGTTKDGNNIDVVSNVSYTKKYETRGEQSKVIVIKIPKSIVGFVPVGSYHFKETIDHMPLVSTVLSFLYCCLV
jgi:hypothetical protein